MNNIVSQLSQINQDATLYAKINYDASISIISRKQNEQKDIFNTPNLSGAEKTVFENEIRNARAKVGLATIPLSGVPATLTEAFAQENQNLEYKVAYSRGELSGLEAIQKQRAVSGIYPEALNGRIADARAKLNGAQADLSSAKRLQATAAQVNKQSETNNGNALLGQELTTARSSRDKSYEAIISVDPGATIIESSGEVTFNPDSLMREKRNAVDAAQDDNKAILIKVERRRSLFAAGAISQEELDNALREAASSEARLSQANASLARAQAQIDALPAHIANYRRQSELINELQRKLSR
jgi:multidrug resistance efflux pump